MPFKLGQRHASEPLSGLTIQDLRIYKQSLAPAEIESLAFRTTFEPMSLVFIGTGIGLGLVGYLAASTVEWLSWVLYISGVLIIGFGIIGWVGYRIFIHSHGEAIGIACNDLPEEGRGFVISVRLLLRAARQKTGLVMTDEAATPTKISHEAVAPARD